MKERTTIEKMNALAGKAIPFALFITAIYVFFVWKPCGVGVGSCGLDDPAYQVLEVTFTPKFADASVSLHIKQTAGNWTGLHGGDTYAKCYGEKCNFLKPGDILASCGSSSSGWTCNLGS